MKKILSIFLSLIIAYGSLNLFLYYQVKDSFDRLFAKLDPIVQIEYQGISVSPLQGKTTLSRLSITQPHQSSIIHIDSATITGLEFYPLGEISLDSFDLKKTTPKAISLKGIKREVQSAIPRLLEKINKTAPFHYHFSNTMVPLYKLGYQEIISDIDFKLTPQKMPHQIQLDFSQTNHDMFNIKLNMLVGFSSFEKLNDFQIYEGAFTYSDLSFLKRFVSLRAKQTSLSANDIQKQIVNQIEQDLESKIHLNQTNKKAISDFIKNTNTISVKIHPFSPLGLEDINKLSLYKPTDIPKILNLSITSE